MKIDRASADGAASRHGYPGLSISGQEGAKDTNARSHRLGDVVQHLCWGGHAAGSIHPGVCVCVRTLNSEAGLLMCCAIAVHFRSATLPST